MYWLALAQEHLANEKSEDALTALRRAEALVPLDPEVYRLLAQALEASGRHPDALAAGLAVTALEEKSAVALFNIGTTYFTNRHWEPAEKWYRLALTLDADLAPANQNLAAILHQRGQWSEADVYRDRAYRCQSLFIDAAETPIRNILILCSARPGNVPFEQLLPETHNTRIKWVIEYSPDHALPSYDIVFNAIGDADVAVSSRKAVDDFLAGIKRPPLNPPQRVALTARDRIGDLLAGIADIRVPPVARWDRSQADAGNADVHARIAAAASSCWNRPRMRPTSPMRTTLISPVMSTTNPPTAITANTASFSSTANRIPIIWPSAAIGWCITTPPTCSIPSGKYAKKPGFSATRPAHWAWPHGPRWKPSQSAWIWTTRASIFPFCRMESF